MLAACGSAPIRPPGPPRLITEAEISTLSELLRHEDNRDYDDVAFNRLAQDSSVLIRARTQLAAGRIGDRAALSLVVAGLADSSRTVRAHAAFALGELQDSSADAVDRLGALSRGRGEDAIEAIAALGKIGSERARTHVTAVLSADRAAGSAEAREALLAIWRFPRRPATAAAVMPYLRSTDPEVRWRATYALTRGGADPASVPVLQSLLRDTLVLVRALAARGLRAATADSAKQRASSSAALATALSDAHPHVRINAVLALGSYRDAAHVPAIQPLLGDIDTNVAIAAAQALGQITGPASVAALEPLVRNTQAPVALRGTALTSFATVAAERGLQLATDWSRQRDWLLRVYAARALANVRTAEALAVLRTLAATSDARVAVAAFNAAATLARDTLAAARALFIEGLAAADPYVRAAALTGFDQLAMPGDAAVLLEAYARALQDPVPDAAVAAVNALGRLARTNAAVAHSFATRFGEQNVQHAELRTALREQFALALPPASNTADARIYEQAVRELVVPALQSGQLPRVRVRTRAGEFVLELFAAEAPLTTRNFLTLAGQGYFRNTRWHRVVPNFVLQDGDPFGHGSGGPGYTIRDEINRHRYLRGSLGMALSGADTGGSQFFVTHSPQPHLDGGYTLFGRVLSGMEVADRVVQDDPVYNIDVIQ